jgi:hypothetical protein
MNKDQFIHYFLGFVDGEGCFHISLKKQKSAKMRWVLDPIFHVTQHKNHKELLYNFQKLIGCGIVIKKYGQPDTMQYVVQSRKELIEKIIPFFKKNKLIVKRKNFEIFAEVVGSLNKHQHSNIQDFRKLVKKVFIMNNGGKYRKYSLKEVLNSLESSETIRQTRKIKLQKS